MPPLPHLSSGHALFNTAELLTSILTHVRDSSKPLIWTKDVARVMRTCRHGFEQGAMLLYEREGAFPHAAERWDLVEYMKKKGSSTARIKFYTSQVRYLDCYSRCLWTGKPSYEKRQSCEFIDLEFWLKEIEEKYPEVSVVHARVGDTALEVVKNDDKSGYKSVLILRTGAQDARTSIHTVYRRICSQLSTVSGQPIPLLGLTFGPKSYTDTLAKREEWLGFPSPGLVYQNLTTLDIFSVPVTWELLGRILERSPNLASLFVYVANVIGPPRYAADVVGAIPLTKLDIKISDERYDDFQVLLKMLSGLDDLKVELTTVLSRDIVLRRSPLRTGVTTLDLSGYGMTHKTILHLLRMCPRVTVLTANGQGNAPTDPMVYLKSLCKACPNVEELTLTRHSEPEFPLLDAIDHATAELPFLRRLHLAAGLDGYPEHMDLPIRAAGPRWPQLKYLCLRIALDTFNDNHPPALAVAYVLAPCLALEATMKGHFIAVAVGATAKKTKAHLEQWWTEMQSSRRMLRQGIIWEENREEDDTPGWRMEEREEEVKPGLKRRSERIRMLQ